MDESSKQGRKITIQREDPSGETGGRERDRIKTNNEEENKNERDEKMK